jgi:azurin
MRPLTILCLALAAAGSPACNKAEAHNDQKADPKPTAAEIAPTPAPAPVPEPVVKPAQHVEIELSTVANTMTFDKKELTVPAGAEVHLVLKNHATMATLPHNWVLVKTGTEASVAAAGLKLGDQAGYIDMRDKDMLAHTPLSKPGENTEVTFTAPEPGTYPYICTVPGHYMLMKGVLTVTP